MSGKSFRDAGSRVCKRSIVYIGWMAIFPAMNCEGPPVCDLNGSSGKNHILFPLNDLRKNCVANLRFP